MDLKKIVNDGVFRGCYKGEMTRLNIDHLLIKIVIKLNIDNLIKISKYF